MQKGDSLAEVANYFVVQTEILSNPVVTLEYQGRCGLLPRTAACSCRSIENAKRTVAIKINNLSKSVLDEANEHGIWFHAKKTRPIWAKRLESAQTVTTLEGEEQVEAGHYLCRGEAGDIWPQMEQDLTRRYQGTDDTDANGWRKYQPNADAEGIMATQIDNPFSVKASWGTLTGKPSDYLLKNWRDRDTAYPDDVWIVDQTLFQQTYQVFK